MQKFYLMILTAGLTIFGLTSTAYAQISWDGMYQKQQQNESVRWTLADWMAQKSKFSTMDHWLAMNQSKDYFELNLQAGRSSYELNAAATEYELDRFSAGFYWSIFGLQYTSEESTEGWERQSGQFNLRLFGVNSQSTYFNLFYGKRKWEFSSPVNELTQDYAGAKLNLYIFNFFGVDGEYKMFFQAKDSIGNKHEGTRLEYGAFLELFIVRLSAGVYIEKDDQIDVASVENRQRREGTQMNIQFYF